MTALPAVAPLTPGERPNSVSGAPGLIWTVDAEVRKRARRLLTSPAWAASPAVREALWSGRLLHRDRRLALQHQAIEIPLLVHVVIGVGLVHDAAVVPHDHVAVLPLMAVLVFLLRRMRRQLGDEIERLVVRHADDALDAHRVQEQRLTAVLGMDAHERMDARRRQGPLALLVERLQGTRAVFAEIDVDGLQRVDLALHRLGEFVI